MKNEKGITLVALIITIIVLIILTGAGITAGINQMNSTQLKAFYTKLEIAEEAVEKIASTNEFYIDSSGNKIELIKLGTALTSEQISLLQSISANYDASKFKYFTADEVESILNVSGVDLNLFINFEDKLVISADGTIYYTLESDKYKVPYQNKTLGNVNFTCEVKKYSSDSYKIIVTPININNIENGIVKYRVANIEDYWKLAKNNEIIVNRLTTYDIMYTDANNNSITKSITIQNDENQNVIIVQ